MIKIKPKKGKKELLMSTFLVNEIYSCNFSWVSGFNACVMLFCTNISNHCQRNKFSLRIYQTILCISTNSITYITLRSNKATGNVNTYMNQLKNNQTYKISSKGPGEQRSSLPAYLLLYMRASWFT